MRNIALFTELFFFRSKLAELLTLLDQNTVPDETWMCLTEAATHVHRGAAERASKLLFEIIINPNIETRILLWCWATLRHLGIHPKSHEAEEIKGIILQVCRMRMKPSGFLNSDRLS